MGLGECQDKEICLADKCQGECGYGLVECGYGGGGGSVCSINRRLFKIRVKQSGLHGLDKTSGIYPSENELSL